MTFGPGYSVDVAALGKGIVREVRNGGRYVVEIKGRSLVVDGHRLPHRPSPHGRPAGGNLPATTFKGPPLSKRPSRPRPRWTCTAERSMKALDALDAFLNTAFLRARGLRIVHGRSGGKLRAAVHARLKMMSSIRSFRLGPRNPGVTIVRPLVDRMP